MRLSAMNSLGLAPGVEDERHLMTLCAVTLDCPDPPALMAVG